MYQLIIIDENNQKITVPFERDEITIGRIEGNTIRLSERNISRNHALLTKEPDGIYIDDLDSYNGVILNGNHITRKSALYIGDILEVGDFKIKLIDTTPAMDLPAEPDINSSKTLIMDAVSEEALEANKQETSFDETSFDETSFDETSFDKTSFDETVQTFRHHNEYKPGNARKIILSLIFFSILIMAVVAFIFFGNSPDNNAGDKTKIVAQKEIRPLQKDLQKEIDAEKKKAASIQKAKTIDDKTQALLKAKAREDAIRANLITVTMEEAKTFAKKQQWAAGEKILNLLLADVPDNQQALKLRQTMRAEKKYQANYKYGLKAINKSDAFKAFTLLSGIAKDSYYYKMAQKRLLTAKAKLLKEFMVKGWRSYKNKDFETALTFAGKALGIDNTHQDAKQLKIAAKHYMSKNMSKKKPEVEALDAISHYRVGRNYYQKKQYKSAIKHFKTAIDMDAKFAYAWRAIGVCYARNKQNSKAIKAYRKYLKLSPSAKDQDKVKKLIEALLKVAD